MESSDYNTAHLANAMSALAELKHPTQIGPYHIEEAIGEGGMGTVYKAQQQSPIRRVVAIKIIKWGMDTQQVIARFESERQALALMNHPNIAKVLDAGATETGRPFFVMEYVPGLTITSFADENRLTLRQRLELFTQACEAVQHAHQKAIIHRDLKPSNILVTLQDERPVVKVIDFGVAKAISPRLTDKTLFTQAGQLIGTPEYMAPEQSEPTSGAPTGADTRSDVYSLGVVLYQLLSGALPFATRDVAGAADPPRPSTRLSSLGAGAAQKVALSRQVPLETLEKQLKHELDWIPLKAMRQDPAQRYASAAQLAEDIANYLADRPLRAGPESAVYRTRKFLRRNRRGVAALAAMLILLIAGVVATSSQAYRATRSEKIARVAQHQAEDASASMRAVNDFLTQDLLWSAEPARTRGREMTVKEVLDKAARDVAGRFKDQPLTEMAVRNALAGTFRALGQTDLAMAHAQAAVDIVHRLHLEETPDGLEILNNMGITLEAAGKQQEAETLLRQTLQTRRRVLGDDHRQTIDSMTQLALVLRRRGELAEAQKLHRESLDRSRRVFGNDDTSTIEAMNNMVSLLKTQEKFADAEALEREVLDSSRRVYGDDHPSTVGSTELLAVLLWRQGKLDQAEPLLRQSVTDARRILGADHPDTLNYVEDLANLLAARGKLDEAETYAIDTLARARRALGDNHPTTLSMINNTSLILQQAGKLAEAEVLCREALAGNRRALGDEHRDTLVAASNLAFLLAREGKSDEAQQLLRQLIDTERRVLGDDNLLTLASITNLGGMLFEQKKYDQAEPLFRQALDGRRRVLSAGHPEILGALSNLGRTLEAQDKLAEAEPIYAELYHGSLTAQLPPKQAALFIAHWGQCLARLGHYEPADEPLHQAYEKLRDARLERSDAMRRTLTALADVCDHTNRPDQASQFRSELQTLIASTHPATTASR